MHVNINQRYCQPLFCVLCTPPHQDCLCVSFTGACAKCGALTAFENQTWKQFCSTRICCATLQGVGLHPALCSQHNHNGSNGTVTLAAPLNSYKSLFTATQHVNWLINEWLHKAAKAVHVQNGLLQTSNGPIAATIWWGRPKRAPANTPTGVNSR